MPGAKRPILNFIKKHYETHGKAPSIRTIYEGLEDVSKRRFYEIFPEGIGDACRQAGVGADMSRIESTKKARKTQRSKTPSAREAPTAGPVFALTEPQIARLQGVSHLEGGRDIGLIVDGLLDRDTRFREEDLSMDDTKAIFNYLDKAKKKGWTVDWVLRLHVRLWNSGIMSMSSQTVEDLAGFLEDMKERGWAPGDLSELMGSLLVKDVVADLSPEEGVKLKDLLREIAFRGLTASQYLKEVAEVRQAINLYQEYFNGRITAEQLMRTVQAH